MTPNLAVIFISNLAVIFIASLLATLANLAIFIVSILATLACVGVIAFVALVLSVARAQEKVDDQREIIQYYRSERQEAIDAHARR